MLGLRGGKAVQVWNVRVNRGLAGRSGLGPAALGRTWCGRIGRSSQGEARYHMEGCGEIWFFLIFFATLICAA